MKLQRMAPDAFQVERYQDADTARSAVEHRRVYAAYVDTTGSPRLLYAGANGLAVTAMVTPLGRDAHGTPARSRCGTSFRCRRGTAADCPSSTPPSGSSSPDSCSAR
ncbi:hypothetical protein E4K10_34150 [Streptomyces sp. T1317-0309]|nr:hypothetical protein E4K10_34150 [Streptomyces sp. T1317-0309]